YQQQHSGVKGHELSIRRPVGKDHSRTRRVAEQEFFISCAIRGLLVDAGIALPRRNISHLLTVRRPYGCIFRWNVVGDRRAFTCSDVLRLSTAFLYLVLCSTPTSGGSQG